MKRKLPLQGPGDGFPGQRTLELRDGGSIIEGAACTNGENCKRAARVLESSGGQSQDPKCSGEAGETTDELMWAAGKQYCPHERLLQWQWKDQIRVFS